MGIANEAIAKVLEDFSEMFNLTPPWSNDIGYWWYCVVNEMEAWLLYFLRDNNVFGHYNNKVLNAMNSILLQRINQIEIAI
jgi:hypothetical protein